VKGIGGRAPLLETMEVDSFTGDLRAGFRGSGMGYLYLEAQWRWPRWNSILGDTVKYDRNISGLGQLSSWGLLSIQGVPGI
jgi:hypothetical protein